MLQHHLARSRPVPLWTHRGLCRGRGLVCQPRAASQSRAASSTVDSVKVSISKPSSLAADSWTLPDK